MGGRAVQVRDAARRVACADGENQISAERQKLWRSYLSGIRDEATTHTRPSRGLC